MADISIHSPRMGRDFKEIATISGATNFNPLSPHGERPLDWWDCTTAAHFNPLSPHGERLSMGTRTAEQFISIHSPRMGRDSQRSPS